MCIGHNVVPSVAIIDYAKEKKVDDKVEVVGLCCTAHDMTRYYTRARIVGPISWELRFIRAGLADVVVLDEQCIRTDVAEQAAKVNTPVIAASEKNCVGFETAQTTTSTQSSKTSSAAKSKVSYYLTQKKSAKSQSVSHKQLLQFANARAYLPTAEEVVAIAKTCTQCKQCQRNCPQDFAIPPAMKAAAAGDLTLLTDLYEVCIGCGRCESACPQKIMIHSLIVKAGEKSMYAEDNLCRSGRGAVSDVEIRNVGSPIVLGEIPGIVAIVGCSNYPKGGKDVYDIAREFASRRYIVVLSGCSAMSAGSYRNEEGKTLYEEFPGGFEAGGVSNVGSCVANSHIAGAAIKVANIFAKRPLRGNYEEIADYIHNRLGAVGLAWGAYSQKAAAIGAGFWRLGVPVVVGPHGSKYRRTLQGRKEDPSNWNVLDARTGETVNVGPSPEHLFAIAETKEECIVMIAKLCFRPNDTWKGRAGKLSHYIDLHKRYMGVMPNDIHLYVRTMADVPITMKDEITKLLEANNWKETTIPDPTLLPRMVRKMK